MGNIDEKRLSALLERIGKIKVELDALENEARELGEVTEPVEVTAVPTTQVSELVVRQGSPTTEETVPTEVSSAPIDDAPIEIDIQDIDIPPIVEDPAEPATGNEKPVAEPVEATVPPETQPTDDLPFGDDIPIETEEEPLFKADEVEQPQKPRKAIVDSTKAETAVMDVMADNQAWRTDRPGLQVKNIISAISLNDRVLLINVLFKENPLLFQDTISAFNAMTTLDEAVSYIQTNFPEWDLNSEPVYRLMMAVRRKLR